MWRRFLATFKMTSCSLRADVDMRPSSLVTNGKRATTARRSNSRREEEKACSCLHTAQKRPTDHGVLPKFESIKLMFCTYSASAYTHLSNYLYRQYVPSDHPSISTCCSFDSIQIRIGQRLMTLLYGKRLKYVFAQQDLDNVHRLCDYHRWMVRSEGRMKCSDGAPTCDALATSPAA